MIFALLLVAKQSHCSWVIWELLRRCLACPLEKLGVILKCLNVLLFVMILRSLMVSWSWKIIVKNEHHCNSNLNTWQWQFSSTLFLWIKNDLESSCGIIWSFILLVNCSLLDQFGKNSSERWVICFYFGKYS